MDIKKVVSNPASIAGIVGGPAALGMAGGLVDAYINYKNYQLQKEQYKYEKGLQQTIFQREDNATQRRVADLRAAGLSPVLAAGSAAGSGAVISTEAPQIGQSGLTEKALAMANMVKMEADISRTKAEERYIEQQRYNAQKGLPTLIDSQRANAQAARATAYSNTQEGRNRQWEAEQRARTGLKGGSPIDLIRDTIGNVLRPLDPYRPNNSGRSVDRPGTVEPGWRITPDGFTERIRK